MNNKVTIKEINSKTDYNTFVMFPFELYRGNPYWVPPIINEEIETIKSQVKGPI